MTGLTQLKVRFRKAFSKNFSILIGALDVYSGLPLINFETELRDAFKKSENLKVVFFVKFL